jgi:hypothetical protein
VRIDRDDHPLRPCLARHSTSSSIKPKLGVVRR